MKKGMLIKEGKYWKVKSVELKAPMNVPGNFGLTDDMLNKEVEFDTTGGPIKLIRFNNKDYKKIPVNFTKNTKRGKWNNQNYSNNAEETDSIKSTLFESIEQLNYARAPYNFVPINDYVVKSPLKIEEVIFNQYDSARLTGEISLEIESLSPIYIRGTKSVSADSSEKTSDFFKGKDYCIPGSSLRGLLRTMTEIVSYSRMGSVNKATRNKRFHYRAFADQSLTLRKVYASKMMRREGSPPYYFPKVQAGIIKKRGKYYFICEGLHYKVEEDLVYDNGIVTEKMSYLDTGRNQFKQNRKYRTEFKTIYFKASPETVHHHSRDLKYAKIIEASNIPAPSFSKGYLVCTGWMVGPGRGPRSRGKHMHWVIGDIDYSNEMRISPEVVDNYINDTTRNGMDVVAKLKNKAIDEVPCFFIKDKYNSVISFGHTGMFRLAYDKTLIEFFPEDHGRIDKPDFTEVLFGKSDVVPSRIFIEDAFIQEGTVSPKEKIPSIMGSPKPTTFQHYLKQDFEKIKPEYNNKGKLGGFRGLNDYNQKTVVNGYKLYWHQGNINYPSTIEIKTSTLRKFLKDKKLINRFQNLISNQNRTSINLERLTEDEYKAIVQFNLTQKDAQHTAIRPILSNAKFRGTIRFENLNRIELGAILFVLNLPDNLCLKIGMGKGLGFGSIRVKSEVILSNREQRYTNLLSGWNSFNESDSTTPPEANEFVREFEKYVLQEIDSSHTSLWQEDRLIELKTMLDINNQITGEKANYMLIRNNNGQNEYKFRPILQSPTEYIKIP